MTVGSEYADDLKHELLSEMADNFFSRRRRLDERLEAFAVLGERVARRGAPALALWRAFRCLLLAGEPADAFLTGLGYDVAALTSQAAPGPLPWRPRRPLLALTAAGRYRRVVLAFYERLRAELEDYNEGGYAPDPRDPRRMGRIPGHAQMLRTAEEINAEVASVNISQCPSDVLQFSRSLDPVGQEREATCGGFSPGQACCLDRELSFSPIDIDALAAPRLPTPPPLEEIEPALSELAQGLYAAAPQAARAALDALTR